MRLLRCSNAGFTEPRWRLQRGAHDHVITRKRGFPFRQPCSYRLMIEKLATSRGPRLLLLRALLAICVALTVGLTVAGTAAAKEACWRTVLNDWSDGRIDGNYPSACYRSAIAHLPTDVLLYSNAKADIAAAMRRRVLSSAGGGATTSRTNGPAKRALARIGPKNATAVPVALIVLTSAALVLIACGLCYEVARRRGGRRAARP